MDPTTYTVMVQYFFVSTHIENIDFPLSLFIWSQICLLFFG